MKKIMVILMIFSFVIACEKNISASMPAELKYALKSVEVEADGSNLGTGAHDLSPVIQLSDEYIGKKICFSLNMADDMITQGEGNTVKIMCGVYLQDEKGEYALISQNSIPIQNTRKYELALDGEGTYKITFSEYQNEVKNNTDINIGIVVKKGNGDNGKEEKTNNLANAIKAVKIKTGKISGKIIGKGIKAKIKIGKKKYKNLKITDNKFCYKSDSIKKRKVVKIKIIKGKEVLVKKYKCKQ